MSIPKKTSRRVVVDDVEYRWRVRGRPTYNQALTAKPLILAVEQCDKRGSVLVVELAQCHPSNWMKVAASGVTPAVVADHIRTALKSGWRPACQGPQFLMEHSFLWKIGGLLPEMSSAPNKTSQATPVFAFPLVLSQGPGA